MQFSFCILCGLIVSLVRYSLHMHFECFSGLFMNLSVSFMDFFKPSLKKVFSCS